MDCFKVAKKGTEGYIDAADGVKRKTLVYAEKTLMVEFKLEKGKKLPMHKHPQEQTGYLVSGHIVMTINGVRNDLFPGDSWAITGNVEHGADIIEDSVAVEVFSPVREDYIP